MISKTSYERFALVQFQQFYSLKKLYVSSCILCMVSHIPNETKRATPIVSLNLCFLKFIRNVLVRWNE